MERHPRAAKTMSPEECGDLEFASPLFLASKKTPTQWIYIYIYMDIKLILNWISTFKNGVEGFDV